jgi:hypothetical protein
MQSLAVMSRLPAQKGVREQAFGRSRNGFACKVHCLGDARGIPIIFHLTPAKAADCSAFEEAA